MLPATSSTHILTARLLSQMESYDATRNSWQALLLGASTAPGRAPPLAASNPTAPLWCPASHASLNRGSRLPRARVAVGPGGRAGRAGRSAGHPAARPLPCPRRRRRSTSARRSPAGRCTPVLIGRPSATLRPPSRHPPRRPSAAPRPPPPPSSRPPPRRSAPCGPRAGRHSAACPPVRTCLLAPLRAAGYLPVGYAPPAPALPNPSGRRVPRRRAAAAAAAAAVAWAEGWCMAAAAAVMGSVAGSWGTGGGWWVAAGITQWCPKRAGPVRGPGRGRGRVTPPHRGRGGGWRRRRRWIWGITAGASQARAPTPLLTPPPPPPPRHRWPAQHPWAGCRLWTCSRLALFIS